MREDPPATIFELFTTRVAFTTVGDNKQVSIVVVKNTFEKKTKGKKKTTRGLNILKVIVKLSSAQPNIDESFLIKSAAKLTGTPRSLQYIKIKNDN